MGGSSSARAGLHLHDSCELRLPLVTVLDELLLIVKELLVKESRVLVVGTFNDSVHGASLLTESAKDALGHVNVVLGSTTRSIRSGL